jgi:hypothetical protein
MSETMTEKQRVAVEALEAARRAGVSLSDYAKAKGLELRPVYDAIAALRRRGALPGTDREERVRLLEEENRWLKAQLFGRSSEKTPPEEIQPRSALALQRSGGAGEGC